MDFAAFLGLKVETSDVKNASTALDGLASTGEKTEKRTKKSMGDITASMQKAARDIENANVRAARQSKQAVTNLTYQLTDIGQMLAVGQSPFIMMVQQGEQVAGAMRDLSGNGGALSGIKAAFRSLFNPVSLATFAVIGFGAYAVQWLGEVVFGVSELTDEIDTMKQGFQEFSGYANTALASIEGLTETYGAAAEKARDLNVQLAENKLAMLDLSTSTFFDEAADPFGLGAWSNALTSNRQVIADFFDVNKMDIRLPNYVKAKADLNTLTDAIVASSAKMASATGLQDQTAAAEEMMVAFTAAANLDDQRSLAEAEYIDQLGTVLNQLYERAATEQNLAQLRSESTKQAKEEAEAQEAVAAATGEATKSVHERADAFAQAAIDSAAALLYSEEAIASFHAEAFGSKESLEALGGAFVALVPIAESSTSGILSVVEGLRGSLGASFANLGAAMSQGLATGLKSALSGVVGAAKNLADAANQAFRDRAQIRSPSRVFKENGEEIGAGLVEGIESSENSVMSSLDSLASSIGDSVGGLFTGAFKSAKDFLKSIFDAFKNTIAQMVSTAISNPIKLAISAAFGGTVGGTGGALAGGGAIPGAGGGGLGVLGQLGGLASAFGTGLSSVWAGITAGGLSGGLGAIGTALSGATTGLSGLATAAGALALPILAIVGIFSFFKKKTKELDAGLRVTVDGMDSLVETFQKTKTSRYFGLVTKTRTTYTEASGDVSNPVQDMVREIQSSVIDAAAALGVGSNAFANFTHQLQISTKGLSEEQIEAEIVEQLGGLGDAFAEMVPGLARLSFEGEGALATLTRVSQSLTLANEAFRSLGFTLFDTSVAGAGAAARMVEAMGGLEQFAQGVDFYFQNFYSLAERSDAATAQFARAMEALNFTSLPTTAEGFRGLVDQLMASGNVEAAGNLIDLAPMFAQMLELQAQVTALGDTSGETAEELARLNAIAAERYGLETRLLTIQGNVSELRRRELRLLDVSNRALQTEIWLLEDRNAAAEAEAQRNAARVAQRRSIEDQILQLEGNTGEIRRRELEALMPANRALQERLYMLQDEAAAAAAEAERNRGRIDERRSIQDQILQLQGNTEALRRRELATLYPANRELQERLYLLQDEAAELERNRGRIDERRGIEEQILQLQGNTAELRRRELAELYPANRELQERLYLLMDEAEALQAAQAVADERTTLENRLLELQGNTAELRRRELEALDPTNRALQLLVWGLEDAQAAIQDLREEDFATLFDFQRAQNVVPFVRPPLLSVAAQRESNDQVARADAQKKMENQNALLIRILNSSDKLLAIEEARDVIGTPPVRVTP